LHRSTITEYLQQQHTVSTSSTQHQQQTASVTQKKKQMAGAPLTTPNQMLKQHQHNNSIRKSSRIAVASAPGTTTQTSGAVTTPMTTADSHQRILREKKRNRNGEFLQEEQQQQSMMEVDPSNATSYISMNETSLVDKDESECARTASMSTHFHTIINITVKLYEYSCDHALKMISNLPRAIQETTTVKSLKARSLFESLRYKEVFTLSLSYTF
jgi:hypothetical protein